MKKEFLTEAMIAILVRSAAATSGLLFLAYAARNYTPGQMADYALLVSISVVVTTASMFGVSFPLIKKIARTRSQQLEMEPAELGGTVYFGVAFICTALSLLMGVVVALSPSSLIRSTMSLPLLFLPAAVLARSLNHVAVEILRANLNKVWWAACVLVFPVSQLFFLLGLTIYAGGESSPTLAFCLAAYLAAFFSTSAIFVILKLARVYYSFHASKEMLSSGRVLFTTEVVSVLAAESSIFFLFWLASDNDVANYAIALRVAGLSSIVVKSVNMFLAPRFADALLANDKTHVQILVTLTLRYVGLYACSILSIGIVFGGQVLPLIFGPHYAEAYIPVVILLAANTVKALSGPGAHLLNASEEYVSFRAINIKVASLTIFLTPVLIIAFGVVGAALALLGSEIVMGVLVWSVLRKKGITNMKLNFLRAVRFI